MKVPDSTFSSNQTELDRSSYSPKHLLISLLAGIFIAEVLAMTVIYYIHPQQYWIETLLDASIMTLLIFPVLYYLHFRPLLNQITERRRSEILLGRVLENLPVGVWIIGPDGAIRHGNRASLDIWSGAKYVNIDQYGEYKAWRLDSGTLIEPYEWAVIRSIREGETILDEELEIECFDGTHKIILNSAIPIYEKEAIQGAIVVNQDITERKQFEQDLIYSNELIQKAFNSVDILIAYMDRDFNFIQVNETYARNGGYPADFFIGKNHFDLYPNPENQVIFQRVVDSGKPNSVEEKPFEYPEFPERGVTYWNWLLQPILGSDGCVQNVVLSLVDVTERKRAEILLEQQNQDLNKLSIAESKLRKLAEGLVQSMLALNASLELDEVLNNTLEQIQGSKAYEIGNIVLIDNDSLRVVRQFNPSGEPEEPVVTEKLYPLDEYPFVKQIFLTHEPVLIEDTIRISQPPIIPGMECLRTFIAIPLIVGERVTGVINLTSSQPGNFNRETTRRLQAFAAPAALAIENARLYAAEIKTRQLAETLNEVSLALTQTLNFDKVMDTLLEYVCRMVPSDRAYIVVFEDETNLVLQAMRNCDNETNPNQAPGMSYDPSEKPYLLDVLSTRKSLLIPDILQYPGQKPWMTGESMRSWLGIPIVVGTEAIGALTLANTRPNFFTNEHIRMSEVIVSQASVAIQNAWLFEQVCAGHERLQSLSRRLVEVQENERRYIARELHDEANQALTALMYGLRLLEQEVQHPDNILPRLRELKKLTDRVLDELHRLAMDLRPASLDYLGLVVALEQLVKEVDDRYSLNIHFKAIGSAVGQRLPDHFETNVYRIVQEALTNAVRHAKAKNIDVILEHQAGKVVVMVEDDGVGFDTLQAGKSGHFGVMGMQERAQMMSGTLQIESIPGSRTTIVLEVPYDDSNLNR